MQSTLFEVLLEKYLTENITPGELTRFFELLEAPENRDALDGFLREDWDSNNYMLADDPKRKERNKERIMQALNIAPVVAMHKGKSFGQRWYKSIAAAVLILLLAGGVYFAGFSKKAVTPDLVNTKTLQQIQAPDVNRAMLTLADGTVVYLDSVHNGELVQQGGVKLVKLANGQIAYAAGVVEDGTPVPYNTVKNPRGSQVIDITLSDGSRIWLNAESSITYPVAFSGNERKVSITGEAYFEVATIKKEKNETTIKQPFIVESGEMAVTVLGTHFNVNTYKNEKDIRVTLLEGRVQVNNKEKTNPVLLQPGEQAVVNKGKIGLNRSPNLEEIMAWKNGMFIMQSTDLAALMRQLERWYDIEVKQVGEMPDKTFGGTLNKDISLSSIMEALKNYGINSRFANGQLILE